MLETLKYKKAKIKFTLKNKSTTPYPYLHVIRCCDFCSLTLIKQSPFFFFLRWTSLLWLVLVQIVGRHECKPGHYYAALVMWTSWVREFWAYYQIRFWFSQDQCYILKYLLSKIFLEERNIFNIIKLFMLMTQLQVIHILHSHIT